MQAIHTFVHRFNNPDFGILLVRLAIGVVFLYHGWMKVQNIEATIGFFGALGFAPWMAYLVAWAEVLGGVAFIVGFLARYAGIVLGVVMAVAVFNVHWSKGFLASQGGYEFAMVLMLASIAMLCFGSGRYSLAQWLRKR